MQLLIQYSAGVIYVRKSKIQSDYVILNDRSTEIPIDSIDNSRFSNPILTVDLSFLKRKSALGSHAGLTKIVKSKNNYKKQICRYLTFHTLRFYEHRIPNKYAQNKHPSSAQRVHFQLFFFICFYDFLNKILFQIIYFIQIETFINVNVKLAFIKDKKRLIN